MVSEKFQRKCLIDSARLRFENKIASKLEEKLLESIYEYELEEVKMKEMQLKKDRKAS